MEQLIANLVEFLTRNIFIVIFIVGLIYTMFFRKSPIERPPGDRPVQRPNNRMPDFGGSPAFPPQSQRPAAHPVERKGPPPAERREPRPEYREPSAQPVYRSPEKPVIVPDPELAYRTAPEPAAAEAPSRAVKVPVMPPVSSDETSTPLTRGDLTRAVVWAEILGPPRSRRPFRR